MSDKCKENTGFLTLRRCDKEATGTCGFCGKPVCAEHGQQTPAGMACITCIKSRGDLTGQQAPPPQKADGTRDTTRGYDGGLLGGYFGGYHHHHYYDDYHYRPYSVHDRFDERDYGAVKAEAPDKGSYEEGFEGS